MRGGNKPHIDPACLRGSHSFKSTILYDAQQLYLRGQRDVLAQRRRVPAGAHVRVEADAGDRVDRVVVDEVARDEHQDVLRLGVLALDPVEDVPPIGLRVGE